MTTEFQITDSILEAECRALAKDALADCVPDGEDPEDYRNDLDGWVHETVDGHEWVIYNHKALMLCAHCDTPYGDEFIADVGMPDQPSIYSFATAIAYGEIRGRIEAALQDLIDAWEPADA